MSRRSAGKAEPRVAAQPPQEVLGVGYLWAVRAAPLLTGLDGQLEPLWPSAMQFGVLKHLAEARRTRQRTCVRRMHYDTVP